MKNYLSMILVTFFFALTGCAGRNRLPEPNSVSAVNSSAAVSNAKKMPDSSFSKKDYKKLLALQFDDYKHMTISQFQKKVWKRTDTPEYRNLLERFFKSDTLYKLKDSDETAYFLFHILEPLTAENWKTRDYSGAATSDFSFPAENATLEYTFMLTIRNPDIMVKDYNDTRSGVIDMMRDILKNRTKKELQNGKAMRAKLQSYVDDSLRYFQKPELQAAVEFAYFPPQGGEAGQETRRYLNGTKKDYRSLLVLKTSGYQNTPLADFNCALLDWANENPERMERIGEDTVWNDFQAPLTDEERSFVELTVFLSGMENGKEIQSSDTGRSFYPYYGEELPQKVTGTSAVVAWCSLYYRFSYDILDKKKITVGERDRRIADTKNAIRTFWSEADIEHMLKMNKSGIVKKLEEIAAAYSTDNMMITINEKQVRFERMDERAYAY